MLPCAATALISCSSVEGEVVSTNFVGHSA